MQKVLQLTMTVVSVGRIALEWLDMNENSVFFADILTRNWGTLFSIETYDQ